MSEIITHAIKALNEKLSDGFDGIAKFQIEGEGSIMLDENGVREGDEEAEVTMIASTETFSRDSGWQREPDHGLHVG